MRIANLIFAIAVSVASLYSVLAVSEKNQNGATGAVNHWHELERRLSDARFDAVKSSVKEQKLDADLLPAARELASLYRQLGKQQEAAQIYRILWLTKQPADSFVGDALDLASLYCDMSAFTYALESYQKILQYDRSRQCSNSVIARDLNNLAVCYRSYAITLTDSEKKKANFDLAAENFASAAKLASLCPKSPASAADEPDIISTNQSVLAHDQGQRE